MHESNPETIRTVYIKAEELFGKLEKITDEFIGWTALGHFDIEHHIEEYFNEVQDWEDSF